VRDDQLLEVLHSTATAVRHRLDALERWELAGTRPGQYTHDLAADEVAVANLLGAGLGVVSEESGVHHPERGIVVLLDPVDGSTNASHGLPWWATSMCALDGDGMRAAVVVNQATGVRFEATRGGGARADGVPIAPSSRTSLAQSFVALSGYPERHLGWDQFRALGAAALDLCAVASGSLDSYVDCGTNRVSPWDYLGGLLICQEAGAFAADIDGLELVVRDHSARRKLIAAATPELLGEVLAARLALG
jgi:fructose-1,6-bisphosphatase/inositol monophosphatase family enzyme